MSAISQKAKIIAVAGIDTGIGKTVATGLMARWLLEQGRTVITMKMAQTGGVGLSEDIVEHRKLSEVAMYEEDAMGLTCPYVFSVPCSPHLAARLDGARIDPAVITAAVDELAEQYEYVLVEGVGGLFVPLNDEVTVIDYIAERNWQLILVSGPYLGSINHTLAALEAIEHRDIKIQGLIYNLNDSTAMDPRIVDDSRAIFAERLVQLSCPGRLCDIPPVSCTQSYCVDFKILFEGP